jgi:phosphoglycerol transferase MdoB-like AlkP superfamily enzyme
MQRILQGLNKETTPFFATWLTLSSHEPFEVPVPTVFEGKDEASLFLNSLHYTDEVLYEFIGQCRQQPWWQNTLVVITGDHGHRQPPTGKKIDDFKIPLLLLGGAVSEKGVEKDRTGSQVDIAVTILAQLGIPAGDFIWSRNLLDSSSRQWAWFSFNNGYGFVEPGSHYIFDNVGKKAMEQSGDPSEKDIKQGKAIQQLAFGDYLGK